ncbi:unnamed protein product [Rotaria sordida]|uniref:Uncharacterized protein n=1 Tax=Rotaria sordida TaxID=392033 RepID=A0A815MUJ6_9BILA|nr:unnamed protein product [Rotaria sordida]CAF4101045.1 unnamed protein product [Rotaria sordida]
MEEIQSKRPINVSDTKLWPKEVSSLMEQLKNDNIIDESSCLIFVNQCLQELYNKKKHYRREFNVKTTRLSGYNCSMEYTIEKFVQQGLQSLHIEINEHIATVQYHYTNIIFQHTYFAQNPNTNQIQLMKRIYNNNDPIVQKTTTIEQKQTRKKKLNKHKQIVTSISSRSITEQLRKKKKVKINLITIKPNDRLPKYLTKAPNLLFKSLRLQLKHKLNTKKQQKFIYCRLQLFDQQQRLDIYRNLWHSYLTLGSQHQIWPNQIYKRMKTNEHTLCQQFVQHHLTELHREYDQCTMKIITQSQLCPSKLLPLDIIDHNLQEFVQL